MLLNYILGKVCWAWQFQLVEYTWYQHKFTYNKISKDTQVG